MQIQEIELDDIILDPALNLRDRLDEDTVTRYIDAWTRLPPVTVFEVEGRLLLADGFHRHAAAVTLGKKMIRAEVQHGTFSEALDYVAGANLFHGLPLSRSERRRAIEIRLRLHHDRSDRHLAEEMSVGRELVAKIRRQLIETNQIPAGTTRVGADGKTYPSLPKDAGEHKPKGAVNTQDDPRDSGRREADKAPWDDTIDAMPAPKQSATATAAPWDDSADAKMIAQSPPIQVAAPTIEEMLGLMTRQLMEVVSWTQADGFTDSYRTAGANARGLFQTAVIKLAARADQLRKS
ncbi:MAG: putative transcriptional regulator [Planctomycetota bacterium]|nr:putative transcriptional regulator [Planctomycetota bacterium]